MVPGKEDSFLQQRLQRTGERADNLRRASRHNGSSSSNNCAAGRQQEEMPSVVTPHSLAPIEPRAISPSSTAIVRARPGMLTDFSCRPLPHPSVCSIIGTIPGHFAPEVLVQWGMDLLEPVKIFLPSDGILPAAGEYRATGQSNKEPGDE